MLCQVNMHRLRLQNPNHLCVLHLPTFVLDWLDWACRTCGNCAISCTVHMEYQHTSNLVRDAPVGPFAFDPLIDCLPACPWSLTLRYFYISIRERKISFSSFYLLPEFAYTLLSHLPL